MFTDHGRPRRGHPGAHEGVGRARGAAVHAVPQRREGDRVVGCQARGAQGERHRELQRQREGYHRRRVIDFW